MVSAVSTPQPRASGRAASNAARVRQRWPFSGWAGCQPTARRMPARDSPTTRPCPPSLTVAAKTAMVMSALSASTGSASGPACAAESARSASRNRRLRPAPVGVIDQGEHRVEASHLEDLAYRGLGGGDLELAAPLAHPAQAGEQHVHAGGVAELHTGHVDHDPGGHAVSQDRAELAVQPRSGIEIDLTGNGHDRVIIVKSTRDI